MPLLDMPPWFDLATSQGAFLSVSLKTELQSKSVWAYYHSKPGPPQNRNGDAFPFSDPRILLLHLEPEHHFAKVGCRSGAQHMVSPVALFHFSIMSISSLCFPLLQRPSYLAWFFQIWEMLGVVVAQLLCRMVIPLTTELCPQSSMMYPCIVLVDGWCPGKIFARSQEMWVGQDVSFLFFFSFFPWHHFLQSCF